MKMMEIHSKIGRELWKGWRYHKTIGRLDLIVVDRGEINTHVENREREERERQTDRQTDKGKHRQSESVRAG